MQDIIQQLEEKRAAARMGGGQKRIDAQHAKGNAWISGQPFEFRHRVFICGEAIPEPERNRGHRSNHRCTQYRQAHLERKQSEKKRQPLAWIVHCSNSWKPRRESN